MLLFGLEAVLAALIYPAGCAVAVKLAEDDGQGQQPAYKPAPGYPPIQYAQQQYSPAQYGSLDDMQTVKRSHSVRVVAQRDGRLVANAVMTDTHGRLVMFPALLDTGGTSSYMTHETAKRFGIDLGKLNYGGTTRTQTGVDATHCFIAPEVCITQDPRNPHACMVGADDIRIGILKRDTLRYDILGMSFLGKLRVAMDRGQMVISE